MLTRHPYEDQQVRPRLRQVSRARRGRFEKYGDGCAGSITLVPGREQLLFTYWKESIDFSTIYDCDIHDYFITIRSNLYLTP